MAREHDDPNANHLVRDRTRRIGDSALRLVKETLKRGLRGGFGDLGYAASRPGNPARTNGPDIAIRGAVRYSPSVAIYRPTMWMEDGCNLWQLIYYTVSRKWEVMRSEEIHPGADATQYEEWGLRLMREAIDTAKFVALSCLGYDVTQFGDGALVVAVGPGPAHGILHERDVIVKVGDGEVKCKEDLMKMLRFTPPGGAVELTVESGNRGEILQKRVVVRLAAQPPLLGAIVRTHNLSYDFPVDIDISTEGAGSSGSLAMALGIIDVLTEKDLCTIPTAATGMLKRDGSIGKVIGISQKARSLRRSDVRKLLVPLGAGNEARAAADDELDVIEVANLTEALSALSRPQPSVAP